MKQSMLKRALLTACLSVSMAGVAMAGPVGPVIIPQAGDVVVINHGPDMTFTGNINFDVESQTNNNLQVGSTVIPNVVYGAAFNKTGAPDTIIPAQTYVYVGTKDGANAFTEASDADKKGANWNVETLKKTIVFNRGMSMAKMIGSSARTSKVYTYMKDHYLNLVIVAKDYDDNGARGSGVMMVSKQDNSNDVLLTLYKGPDLSNSKLEKVIGAMLSTNFKR